MFFHAPIDPTVELRKHLTAALDALEAAYPLKNPAWIEELSEHVDTVEAEFARAPVTSLEGAALKLEFVMLAIGMLEDPSEEEEAACITIGFVADRVRAGAREIADVRALQAVAPLANGFAMADAGLPQAALNAAIAEIGRPVYLQ